MSNETKQVVVKKVTPTREILGKKLSTKLPNEVKATIEVIKKFENQVNVPFDTLFSEFLNEMKKISKSNSNLKTRFRRILYRNLETAILKGSIQSAKFNLKANIGGIMIKAKDPIQYKLNGDAQTLSVDTNSFSFKIGKKITTKQKNEITLKLLERVSELKG